MGPLGADQVGVVFEGSDLGEHPPRVEHFLGAGVDAACPGGLDQDLSAHQRQAAGDLRKASVVADEESQPPQLGIGHREEDPGVHSAFSKDVRRRRRQLYSVGDHMLAVLQSQLALRIEQETEVEEVAWVLVVSLEYGAGDVEIVLSCLVRQDLDLLARHVDGHLVVLLIRPRVHGTETCEKRLGKDDELRAPAAGRHLHRRDNPVDEVFRIREITLDRAVIVEGRLDVGLDGDCHVGI